MHVALLLHCYDEFSRPAHASMHSRGNCPVERKSNEEKHAALKDVQNTTDAEKLNSRPTELTASRLALHSVIGLLPVMHELQYHSVS